MYTDQQIEEAIAALMDRAQNKAVVVRTALSMLHTNQAGLAARARGSKFIYAAGRPDDADGLEGDCGIDTSNGDVYEFTAGKFSLLFNLFPKASAFVPIAQNAYGVHPAFTTQRQLDLWLLQNGGAGGGTPTPTPVPTITGFLPMQGAQGSTVVLTGTNFVGATQVSINSATVASFKVDSATQITAVLSSSQMTGRVRVATPGGTAVSSADFTVTLSTTPTVFTPQSSEFRYNQRNDTVSAGVGYVRRDALAAWSLTTDATSLLVRGITNYDAQYLSAARLDVFANGQPFQTLTFTQTGSEQQFSVTGLPAGIKQVDVFEGPPYRGQEQGDVRVANLTGVTVPAGFSASVATPARKNAALIVLGNSRTMGANGANPPQFGYVPQLARQLSADYYLLGYSSLQMAAHIGTTLGQQQIRDEVQARAAGYANVYVVFDDDENDWYNNSASPAQLTGYYRATMAAINSLVPIARQYVQTILADQDGQDNANSGGYKPSDYRAADMAAAVGLTYASVIDSTAFGLNSSDYANNQHLNDAGDTKKAAYYFSQLTAAGSGYSAVYSASFENSTSLPNGLNADSNYVVVSGEQANSGTNSLKLTATAVSTATTTTATVLRGRVSANLLVIQNSGQPTFAAIEIGRQSDGSRYQLNLDGAGGRVVLQRVSIVNNALTYTNLAAVTVPALVGFARLALARSSAGGLAASLQRVSDGTYLNGAGQFASSTAVNCLSYTDPTPLPLVAGPGGMSLYLQGAGDAGYFDDFLLEAAN